MKNSFKLTLVILGLFSSLITLAQDKKYFNHTEFGLLTYDLTFKEGGITAQTFNGYNLNPDLALGAAVGFEKYSVDGRYTFSSIPVSVGVRYSFLEPKTSRMFVGLDAGYGFVWESKSELKSDVSGGLRFAPQIGLKLKLSESGKFMTVGLGYQYQFIKINNQGQRQTYFPELYLSDSMYLPISDYSDVTKMNLNRFFIKLGFGF